MTTENKPSPFGILKIFAQQVGGAKGAAVIDMLASAEGRGVVTKVVQDAASTLGDAVGKVVHDAQVTALEARLKTLKEKGRPQDPKPGA